MTIEYQAPTDLFGTYDPLLLQVDLLWTASIDGIPIAYTVPGVYTFTVDPTADHVVASVWGGGGGGAGGGSNSGSSTKSGGGGGGGGGYVNATFSVSLLGSSQTVTVGAGGTAGTGGSGVNSNGASGGAGVASSFGGFAAANGGGAGLISQFTSAAGGTASQTSGTSVTTETGGTGGESVPSGQSLTLNPNGGNTTNAGGGGGGGGYTFSDTVAGLTGTGGTVNSIIIGGAPGAQAILAGTAIAGAGSVGQSALAGGGAGGGGGGAACNFTVLPNNLVQTGGNGASGGSYGGGGGGGGTSNATDSNGTYTGGNGAAGFGGAVFLTTFWLHTQLPQYLVYRNGTLIGVTAPGVTSFDDLSPLAGVNTYTIYASYDGVTQMSAASNPVTITIAGGVAFVSGAFSPANAFAPIMLINVKGIKPKFYAPVINPNMRSRR